MQSAHAPVTLNSELQTSNSQREVHSCEMSATPPAAVPTYIELDREGRRLLVRWADEHESAFDWEYLRWRCPCAECSGEGNMPGALQSLPMFRPGQTTMADVNLTGRYAVT